MTQREDSPFHTDREVGSLSDRRRLDDAEPDAGSIHATLSPAASFNSPRESAHRHAIVIIEYMDYDLEV